jgi:hypothetical protein
VFYVDALFGLRPSGLENWGIALVGLWIPAAVNLAGIRDTAWLQNITVVLKYLPLLFVGVVGWFFVTRAHFGAFNASGGSLYSASPRPLGLVEIETVRALADAGVLVVCGGGGGVPVARSGAGELTGVEAVVDKDLTAAELASTLKADRLLILTDVPGIIRGYGTPEAQPIQAIDTAALAAMPFPAGSMGPKAEACIRFVTASGQPAAIGALADAADILAGRAGTTISAALPRAASGSAAAGGP